MGAKNDVLTLADYRRLFGENRHEFTGVDYIEYYGINESSRIEQIYRG
ncbi:hypothetical protein H8730_02015 [Clostridiales bacterium NSJ-32]|uniref:Uncharacterized protein n=1 Tax=Bianquea renquensis TaxID=2763661 RepID=A0A926DQR7_9FIRM|nr:hypothetical protein [Bianquea renquensis]MBC8542323.1 hypothetical protein [Bianquea renquensis]